MLLFLLFFPIHALSAAVPNYCEYVVQHPVTKVFHLANSSCFVHVKKDINSFCTKLKEFDGPIFDNQFIIAYGSSSGVVYECSNSAGTPKAIFKHRRTSTGIVVKQGESEAYNEQGDSTHCYQIHYYNKTEPLIEFNNRESCIQMGKSYQLLKLGQTSSDGEMECRGDGKRKTRIVRLGCNSKIGFLKNPSFTVVNGTAYAYYEEHFDNRVNSIDNCYDGPSLILKRDQFIKSDGILWYRCKSAILDEKRFRYAQEQFLGCVSRKIVDPINTPFFYKNGEFMKEYGQKCSPDLKVKVTGKEKFCSLNGLQFEMGTWLRVLISSSDGHFYYCDSDKGKPKASYSNVFRGCFTKTTNSLLVTMVNVSGTGMEKPMKKCVGKTTKYDFEKPLFEDERNLD